MAFEIEQWKDEIRRRVADIATDPAGALQRAGAKSLYTLLLGSTMLPLITAYTTDPATAVSALVGVVGGLGANLAANLIQRKYDDTEPTVIVVDEAERPDMAPVYEQLARATGVFSMAAEAFVRAGQTAVLEQLRAELRELGKLDLLPSASLTASQSGTGNTIGGITSGSSGPTISGSVSSGRDTNIATSLTITNVEPDQPKP